MIYLNLKQVFKQDLKEQKLKILLDKRLKLRFIILINQ